MPQRVTGLYESTSVAGERVQAFLPHPLPPSNPPLDLSGHLNEGVRAAEHALTRLELAGEMVPSLDWFIYAFVRKEAVLSSQIEGTQATLIDLLTFEADEKANMTPPNADVEEVCNYLEALMFARRHLADPQGLPLSIRLLNETHRVLMNGVRGSNKMPGEIRRSQNWIGGSRPGMASFVPPPPHLLAEILSALEKYMHADDTLPAIVRAGLLHVQFETIHPYLDGNGRIGRLLVTLLLEHWGLLSKPLLYLSLYFKRERQDYYRLLNAVRAEGDWEGWLAYFLEGVKTIANEAVETSSALFSLVTMDRERLIKQDSVTVAGIRLFEKLPRHPIVTIGWVVEHFGVSKPTANRAIESLENAGILFEVTGRKRDRTYMYQAYLDRLRTGTEI